MDKVEESISILDILKTTPKALDKADKDTIKAGEYYLPYSIGFEIECFKDTTFNIEDFKSIPNIMDVNVDTMEQRFRIPKGIEGLNCLYDITTALKKNSLLNPESGIHYHVDCTEAYHTFNSEIVKANEKWMLKELESWKYRGTYNSKRIRFTSGHIWIRFQESFKTMECRIGEMTFEYELLFKRMSHLSDIVRKFKNIAIAEHNKVANPILLYEQEDVNKILNNRIKYID